MGSGDSKLGKGGYFSTGDVLLGKDVVSYTVQVFSENNERVGVNTQSYRVQYNLPILADFSVIKILWNHHEPLLKKSFQN